MVATAAPYLHPKKRGENQAYCVTTFAIQTLYIYNNSPHITKDKR